MTFISNLSLLVSNRLLQNNRIPKEVYYVVNDKIFYRVAFYT